MPSLPSSRSPSRVFLAVLALAAGAALPLAASAQDSGAWIVRARALHLDSANKDSTGLNLSINNKVFPEVDISYFFTPNLAAELILTYPQKQDLSSNGTRIGTLKHLPPTLTLQYHVTGLPSARPYVGAGINYTRFSSVNFDPAVRTALGPSIEKSSVGLAAQVGVDIPVGGGWLFNADVKKVYLRTDVRSFGATAGTFKIDPVLFSLGIGKRF
ncbi:OmpW family outer membrane protein [Piscinibacter sakaiensis]|uniref:Outer membrane protein W n=1 Tax=Piscinibacter sakaiensis TaxID=1547922 RepID=A0A0K8P5W3_PISS1|nr:OmpW family outer membrane protein [Piscinibacter sakaiensis]GAP37590.1 outer membrane protein W precursor [Piscinibacter sakaiensis]